MSRIDEAQAEISYNVNIILLTSGAMGKSME